MSLTPRSASSIESRINNFRTQIEDSKYAKLHKISVAMVEKSISSMISNRELASSVSILSVSGSNKYYVAKDSLTGAADHGVT